MSLSQADRTKIEGEFREIMELSFVLENKVNAINKYYSKVLKQDDKAKEAKRKREATKK